MAIDIKVIQIYLPDLFQGVTCWKVIILQA